MSGLLVAPIPASNGLFEPVIGLAPQTWPWALPHIYAANVAAGTGDVIVHASADPTGSYLEQRELRTDIGMFELIGFWQGQFCVIHSEQFGCIATARIAAKTVYDTHPVRFLMERGLASGEDSSVEISGAWPTLWSLKCIHDLNALCAYLYETAAQHGAGEQADEFRSLIYSASPTTEQLMVYVHALESGRKTIGPFLPKDALETLEYGLGVTKSSLR